MLNDYVSNKIVTLHCKEESGLGNVKGIVTEVGLDEGARAFLVLPDKNGQLIIYADQVAYIVVHGTVEEMAQKLKEEMEEKEEEGAQIVSGSVEEIIEVAEDDVQEDEEKEEEEKEVRSRMLDMNDPEVLETLQGQSTGYEQIRDLNKLLTKKQKKKENEGNDDTDEGADPSEDAAQG